MHQPSGGIGGTATDVRINAELIMDMKKTMSELTAEQTGHTLEEIYRDNEYDHWFTAQRSPRLWLRGQARDHAGHHRQQPAGGVIDSWQVKKQSSPPVPTVLAGPSAA